MFTTFCTALIGEFKNGSYKWGLFLRDFLDDDDNEYNPHCTVRGIRMYYNNNYTIIFLTYIYPRG